MFDDVKSANAVAVLLFIASAQPGLTLIPAEFHLAGIEPQGGEVVFFGKTAAEKSRMESDMMTIGEGWCLGGLPNCLMLLPLVFIFIPVVYR
jgi:hypothetical protein